MLTNPDISLVLVHTYVTWGVGDPCDCCATTCTQNGQSGILRFHHAIFHSGSIDSYCVTGRVPECDSVKGPDPRFTWWRVI